MASGGTGRDPSLAPIFTERRIGELRTHLAALWKALRISYADAKPATATQKQRDDANLLIANFAIELEGVEDEYRRSVVTTENVGFHANNLLAELQTYRPALDDRFQRLPEVTPRGETTGVGESTRVESSEATSGGTAVVETQPTAPESVENSNPANLATTTISATGEQTGERFALPPRIPTTPRTPRGRTMKYRRISRKRA